MPWRNASPMDQRTQFIADYLRDSLAITELCEHYVISRKTGDKWIERYLRQGTAGLEERSRRPRRSPNQTAEEIVTAMPIAVTSLPLAGSRPCRGRRSWLGSTFDGHHHAVGGWIRRQGRDRRIARRLEPESCPEIVRREPLDLDEVGETHGQREGEQTAREAFRPAGPHLSFTVRAGG